MAHFQPACMLHLRYVYVNKTEVKNVHSQSLEINFETSDSNNSGGAFIISIDFNSVLFQLSNVGK